MNSGMGDRTSTGRPVALVTGASRGIGREVALGLAAAGLDVAFTGRTRVEGEGSVPPRTQREGDRRIAVPGSLATTDAAVRDHGVRSLPLPMDLLDLDSVRAAADAVLAEWGRVDVVVNNAIAHLPHARFLELDPATLRESLEANHVSQVVLLQRLLPAMVDAGGGVVVDLVSGSVVNEPPAPPGEGGWGLAYSSAKAAFGRVAGAVNAEFRSRGVRAYNLDPGFVVTEAAAARGGTGAIADRGFATTPLDAAARAVVHLVGCPEPDTHLGRTIRATEWLADPPACGEDGA
ncbi:SDR family oxidoreductase [Nocardioides sp. YIM 152315]|uniref:SDR family NAD(P)-dependent oxidoreductase n=1 Tax=Nocardioides sp. YIM 152315 TaxID=3031760 RepID=UPI0023DA8AFF|nr:SDR family oxidoreductase [Nocardioides sp. YIM 152315]MDF1604720.1 SDR family NAD(P)-dependent oxidoreductase [Nocardioides sp. YIM 152315]